MKLFRPSENSSVIYFKNNLNILKEDVNLISSYCSLLEKEMAAHSSVLTWEIPWMEETGGLQSMGSQIVRHNFTTKR